MNSKYKVIFSKSVLKILSKMDKTTALRIVQAVEILCNNPYETPNTKKMKGYTDQVYRLRVGSYRIIYEIIEEKLVISIITVGARGDVYK